MKLIDTIKQAVFSKVFRGKLVITETKLARREGRDYESASALLERIKTRLMILRKSKRKNKLVKNAYSSLFSQYGKMYISYVARMFFLLI